ncbi:hypothetical protein D3C81_1888050 [compost metagenome]
MTEIGKMIYEDGKSKGEEEGLIRGKAEGKAEVLIKQLAKKFKYIPEAYINKIKKLPESVIETIATDIFDLEKVEDIEKYFESK